MKPTVFHSRLFLALTFLLLAGIEVSAQSYVSATGDDLYTCGSADPCRSITRALEVTPAFGTVIAQSGDYAPFVIRRAVSIRAAPGATPRIRLAAGSFARNGIEIYLPRGDYVWLDGLNIVNEVSDLDSTGVVWFTPAEALLVTNCTIEGFVWGLGIISGGYLAMDQCIIRNPLTPGPKAADLAGIYLSSEYASDPIYAEINSSSIYNFARYSAGVCAGNNSHVTLRDCNLTNNTIGVIALPTDIRPGRGAGVTIEACYLFRNGTGVIADDADFGVGPFIIRLKDSYIYYSVESWWGTVCHLGGNHFFGNRYHIPLPPCS